MARKKTTGVLHTIQPDESVLQVPYKDEPTLEELQTAVGGYITPVMIFYEGRKRQGWVDEDGLPKRLPPNAVASLIRCNPAIGSILVGNLVIWVADDEK